MEFGGVLARRSPTDAVPIGTETTRTSAPASTAIPRSVPFRMRPSPLEIAWGLTLGVDECASSLPTDAEAQPRAGFVAAVRLARALLRRVFGRPR